MRLQVPVNTMPPTTAHDGTTDAAESKELIVTPVVNAERVSNLGSTLPEMESHEFPLTGSARSLKDDIVAVNRPTTTVPSISVTFGADNGADDGIAAMERGTAKAKRTPLKPDRRRTQSASGTIKEWRNEFLTPISTMRKYRADDLVVQRKTTTITPVDIDMLRSLEHEYSATAQRTSAQDRAQRIWARRAALTSVIFMLTYFIVGVVVFQSLTEDDPQWTLVDTILFVVYTATSAGFGHLDTPDKVSYYLFNIVYMLVGVAAMAIMVAQLFQWMELEAERAHARRKAKELADKIGERGRAAIIFWRLADRCLPWFQETQTGKIISVVLSMVSIAVIGAVPIGIVEGWSFFQTIYFATVAMSTVGYGDIVPATRTGIILCIAWLPLNVLFTSIYMGSVATWYLNLSARNVEGIRKVLTENIATGQHFNRSHTTPPPDAPWSMVEGNNAAAVDKEIDDFSLNSEEVDVLASTEHSSFDGSHTQEAPFVVFENINSTLTTMKAVIDAIHSNMTTLPHVETASRENAENTTVTDSMRFLSLQDRDEKPCFALRVLVKERMAAIIAYDICGGAHHADVKDTFIVVRIGQWQDVVNKWLIPSGAWRAFRAAALEAMMLVGERALIKEGPSALFQLSPDEFHGMFSPLVAAMGEPDTLEGWLRSTDALAQEISQQHASPRTATKKQHKNIEVEAPVAQMPKTAGTIFQ